MVTKSDMIYVSIDDIVNNKIKLEIKIKNTKLNKLNKKDTINLLYNYNLIKDNNIIIPADSKIKINLYEGMRQYVFHNKDITIFLYFL